MSFLNVIGLDGYQLHIICSVGEYIKMKVMQKNVVDHEVEPLS